MTPQLHLHILASGSKGNAAIVEGPEGCVLIDCGISRRALLNRAQQLSINPDRIVAVLLTHEHTDHVGGLSVFCKHFDGPLYATEGTASARPFLEKLPFIFIDHSRTFELAGMRITTFPTSHDVVDPIGMRFETGEDALGYCTDTGVLLPEALKALHDVRILALEANHDEKMLADGPYPAALKKRVGGELGHLSNDQAAAALPQLIGEHTQAVVAMHLSQKNNQPSVCLRTLGAAVGANPALVEGDIAQVRTPGGRLSIYAAAQDRPFSVM